MDREWTVISDYGSLGTLRRAGLMSGGGRRKMDGALAGVAQWIECQPVNQKVAGSIPSQGTCLGCRPGP